MPRRTPARPGDLTPGEPAWAGLSNDSLNWPLPWLWEVPLMFVPGARDVYHTDDSVMAFMNCGRFALALFRMDGHAEWRLEEVYRRAAGEGVAVPRFLVPG